MRGNLDFFLRRQLQESEKEKTRPMSKSARELAQDFT
jgi:hypothetical protein